MLNAQDDDNFGGSSSDNKCMVVDELVLTSALTKVDGYDKREIIEVEDEPQPSAFVEGNKSFRSG